MPETERLYRIVAPHFVAGIVAVHRITYRERDMVVVDAAPIVAYMKGWTMHRVVGYVTKKGWTIS